MAFYWIFFYFEMDEETFSFFLKIEFKKKRKERFNNDPSSNKRIRDGSERTIDLILSRVEYNADEILPRRG